LTAHCRSQTNFFPRIGHIRRVTLAGVITTINGKTVSVQVTCGNPIVREYIGQALALQTTSSTRYLLKTDTGVVPITFADLAVGQKVSASGTVANNVWTTVRITVGANLIHLP
jgi:hypothetical protein